MTATDSDSSSWTYSISGTEINISSSGVLSFASAPDKETKNSYTATVTASDGTNSSVQSITISVGNIDEDSDNPSAPALSGFFASEGTNENSTDIITWSVSDADGDSVSASLSGVDSSLFSASIVNSGNSLRLSFVNAPDFENPSDADGNNIFLVTITLSDRSGAEADDWDGTVPNTAVYNLEVTVRDVTE